MTRNLNYLFKTASENTEKGNKYKVEYKIIQINLNYNNGKKFTKSEELIIMLDLNKEDLEELAEKSDKVKKYKDNVDKANNDEFIVNWINREEEQKQYEEVLYEKAIEKTNIDNAKKMLELNIDLEIISKVTGLMIEKIESLRN